MRSGEKPLAVPINIVDEFGMSLGKEIFGGTFETSSKDGNGVRVRSPLYLQSSYAQVNELFYRIAKDWKFKKSDVSTSLRSEEAFMVWPRGSSDESNCHC